MKMGKTVKIGGGAKTRVFGELRAGGLAGGGRGPGWGGPGACLTGLAASNQGWTGWGALWAPPLGVLGALWAPSGVRSGPIWGVWGPGPGHILVVGKQRFSVTCFTQESGTDSGAKPGPSGPTFSGPFEVDFRPQKVGKNS